MEAIPFSWDSSLPSSGLASPKEGQEDSKPEDASFSTLPLSSVNSARLQAPEWIKSDTSRIGLGPQKDPKTTVPVEILPKELL